MEEVPVTWGDNTWMDGLENPDSPEPSRLEK